MDARAKILERRARFVAAALAASGVACEGAPPAVPLVVPSAEPTRVADVAPPAPEPDASLTEVEDDPALTDDRDGDGIPDDQDACPTVPGGPSPDPKKHGCPCLTIVMPSSPPPPPNIELDANSATIKPQWFVALDDVAATLQRSPAVRVAVEGHCDSTEPDALADRRAQAVRAYLVKKGVAASRIVVSGFGSRAPVASNATPAGRAHNRRVEVRYLP